MTAIKEKYAQARKTKIVDSWLYDYDGNNGLYGEIVTEDGTAYEVIVYSDVDESGFPGLSKNVKVEIGSLTTNTLEKCNFFTALERARDVIYAAVNYYENSGEVSRKQFEGYNADEEKNIDDLVALSTMVLSGYNDYEYVAYDDYCIYKLSVGTVEDNIEKVLRMKQGNHIIVTYEKKQKHENYIGEKQKQHKSDSSNSLERNRRTIFVG